eukprot:18987_1
MILKQRCMISSCIPGSIGRNTSNKYVADSIETRVLILTLYTTPQPCTPGIRSQKQPSNAMVIPAACTVPTGLVVRSATTAGYVVYEVLAEVLRGLELVVATVFVVVAAATVLSVR